MSTTQALYSNYNDITNTTKKEYTKYQYTHTQKYKNKRKAQQKQRKTITLLCIMYIMWVQIYIGGDALREQHQ